MDCLEELGRLEASAEEKATRATEFSHLQGMCYLDYSGAGVYTQSQMTGVWRQMSSSLLSHPHASTLSVAEVDQVRARVLRFFNTDASQYSVIFTSGATAALRTVAECFTFNGGSFVFLVDNHTSVLGMRAVVKTDTIHSLSADEADEILNEECDVETKQKVEENCLFVYPAQSNFNGTKYPLSWTNKVHASNKFRKLFHSRNGNWFVLLDAAAFCASSPLDLTKYNPDFVCLSFYKLFGYPTGLGALLVKNTSAAVLNKTYYGGGTVKIALAGQNFHVKKDTVSDRFEDGTLNFLGILSLQHGFDSWERTEQKTSAIFELARYTYLYLKHLQYPNQQRAVELYHDTDFSDISKQGSVVNFNLLRQDGSYFGYSEVQNLANLKRIQLRTGCHCNQGSCQRFLRLTDETLKYHFHQGHVCGDDRDIIDSIPTGSVRISYGRASNWDDVRYFLSFVKQYFLTDAILNATFHSIVKKINEVDTLGKVVEKTNIVDTGKDEYVENNEIILKEVTKLLISGKPDVSSDSTVNEETKLEKIFLYPVKACGFYEVENTWEITDYGLLYDRQWMIVTRSGVALTQKMDKNLCLVHPGFDFSRRVLILSYKTSQDTVAVSLEPDTSSCLEICSSKVCNESTTGYDCGDKVAYWLDQTLGHSGLRLIRLKQRASKRNLNSFSNMGQYLLITRPSVRYQIKTLENKFDASFAETNFVHRFRSNFLVSGAFDPDSETEWKQVCIVTSGGLVTFDVKSRCTRCQYIYVDQETGLTTNVPLGITKFGIYISNGFSMSSDKRLFVTVGDTIKYTEYR